MNIPKGYKLVPINPTAEMIEAAFVGKVEAQSVQHQQRARDAMGRDYQAIVAATPEPPAFDGEPSVIAFASFATNGNLRCWSSDCEAVGLKVIAEGGGPITALIDRENLRFHVRVSEHVEAHLSQQIDILTIDLNAARERVKRMTSALELVATLRGTLEQHGMLDAVEKALGKSLCSHIWVKQGNRGTGGGEVCQACTTTRRADEYGEVKS